MAAPELTTDLLIIYLQNNECLWKLDSRDYKNVLYKNQVMESIGRRFGLTGLDIKGKIKSLKDQFRREYLKRKTPSGSGYVPPKTSKGGFKHYKEMLFLKDNLDKQEQPTDSNFIDSDSMDSVGSGFASTPVPSPQLQHQSTTSNFGTVVQMEGKSYLQVFDKEGGSALYIIEDKSKQLEPPHKEVLQNQSKPQPIQPRVEDATSAATALVQSAAKKFAEAVTQEQESKFLVQRTEVNTKQTNGQEIIIVDDEERPLSSLSTHSSLSSNDYDMQFDYVIGPSTSSSVAATAGPSNSSDSLFKPPILNTKNRGKNSNKRKQQSSNESFQEQLPTLIENASHIAQKMTDKKFCPLDVSKPEIPPFMLDLTNSFNTLPEKYQDEAKMELLQVIIRYKKLARGELPDTKPKTQ